MRKAKIKKTELIKHFIWLLVIGQEYMVGYTKEEQEKNKRIIEILEHIAIAYKDDEEVNSSLVNIKTSTLITNGELAQAISNLLKENENLKQAIKINQDLYETKCNENKLTDKEKEIVEAYRNLVKLTGKTGNWVVCDPTQMWSEHFIPKSLVKEKIEELDERLKKPERTSCWASYTIGECIGIRRILQELLGDEK